MPCCAPPTPLKRHGLRQACITWIFRTPGARAGVDQESLNPSRIHLHSRDPLIPNQRSPVRLRLASESTSPLGGEDPSKSHSCPGLERLLQCPWGRPQESCSGHPNLYIMSFRQLIHSSVLVHTTIEGFVQIRHIHRKCSPLSKAALLLETARTGILLISRRNLRATVAQTHPMAIFAMSW